MLCWLVKQCKIMYSFGVIFGVSGATFGAKYLKIYAGRC
jgi:hypothetical protein